MDGGVIYTGLDREAFCTAVREHMIGCMDATLSTDDETISTHACAVIPSNLIVDVAAIAYALGDCLERNCRAMEEDYGFVVGHSIEVWLDEDPNDNWWVVFASAEFERVA